MGRYYDGDIEGKFWFGVQPSNDANFFGVKGETPYLNYYFQEDDLPKIQSGIDTCLKELGGMKAKLDKFFNEREMYNKELLEDTLNISKEETNKLLEWYARLELGNKILKCVKENNECSFNAEL
tara:strand:+ start:420 stop:791 length:372 start_codon:yes stop_codon:yes gene_type:complete